MQWTAVLPAPQQFRLNPRKVMRSSSASDPRKGVRETV